MLDAATFGVVVPEAAPDFGSAFTDLLAKERGQIVLAEEDDVLLGMVNVSYNVALRDGRWRDASAVLRLERSQRPATSA